MKRIFVFMMSLLCALNCFLFLMSCKSNEDLTDMEKTKILAAYENISGDPYGTIDLYYGKHKGYIVFEMMSVLPAEKVVKIGNQIFYFTSQNDLWTFKDESLVLLEKVYDRGDLNDKDIENIHTKYLQTVKKTVSNYDEWYKSYQEKVETFKNTASLDSLKINWSGLDTKTIKTIWEKQKGKECKMDYKLGKYNYSFVFVEMGSKEESKTITVAEHEFTYSKDFTIWVYKDRDIIQKEEFITLEEAYQKGYLSKDDIDKIHNLFLKQLV